MDKVLNYLLYELNLKSGDIIVIANSGGPDSMALMHVLLKVRMRFDIKLICAHVNHNVRVESQSEEDFLKKFCEDEDVVFEKMKIEKFGDDNFHNEARMIRYNFFEAIVKKYGAHYLMTAHHADDLMETVLMRIVRGSSLKGYGGFKILVDKGSYKLVRPLIFMTKSEISDYDENNSIPYVIDNSNFKDKYTRNRYRHVVLPFLKSEDKNVHEKFIKFSNLIFEYDEFVDEHTKRYFDKVVKDDVVNILEYKKVDKLIQSRILLKILENCYNDDLILINDSHVSLINKLIFSNKKNGYINLPNNIIVLKCYDTLEIKKNNLNNYSYRMELSDYVELPNGHVIEFVDHTDINDNNYCKLKKDEVCFPLYVRNRMKGDRMKLKKIDGSKKIKDIFIDCKVALDKRDTWPIVVDSNDEIVWIPGIKKSKFTKSKSEKCDIILKYQ